MNHEATKISNSFSATVQLVENYALEEIQQQTLQKQLYYHTVTHAIAVKRRAKIIFEAVRPSLEINNNYHQLNRIANLIDLCAIAHDLVQEITPATKPHTARKRPKKISELATIDKLTKYINTVNQQLTRHNLDDSTKFNHLDLQIITEAIAATICELAPLAGESNSGLFSSSIYQPYLYHSPPKISLVANIIALADLGTLGMEGVEPFIHEGILIFLEENPDLVELILRYSDRNTFSTILPGKERKITKQRLLNMTRFMVNLAKDRHLRFKQEIISFPTEAQHILQERVFKYLKLDTINKIEELTPTDECNNLEELLNFFHIYSQSNY
ncbi:MAG: hypothetical protein ACFCU5_18610 [Pleurocapsa sp.]